MNILRAIALWTKRLVNYALVNIQFRLATSRVWGNPYVLILDTINVCNLKCPLCPTGLGMPGRPKGRMEFGMFKKIIDELGDYAYQVVLHNWGEPLLNNDIYSMIEYAKSKRIKTILSSNLNVLEEADAEMLIRSGLDELIVSLDGASQKTYAHYRRGGDFQRVIDNINLLYSKRDELSSSTPKIIWQFLVFKHNAHEVSEAKSMAERMRVDKIDVCDASLGGPNQTPYVGDKGTTDLASEWLCSEGQYVGEFDYFSNPEHLTAKRCHFLWKTVTISWDGSISPCCCVYDSSTDFGDLRQQSFKEIWNNDRYRGARSLFGRSAAVREGAVTICSPCKVFKKTR